MADFRSRQRVQLHDGTDEFAVTSAKPIYVHLSDGTETVNVNASNQLEVDVKSLNDGGNSITIDGTLTGITNDVNIADGGNSITVDDGGLTLSIDGTLTGITNDVNIADGGNSITVDASQLDIDNLNKDDDEILIWANTAKDGTGTDYVPVVTNDGYLRVDIASGSSNDTLVDDSAFTVGTDEVYPMGALFDDTATDTVDEGDIGAPRMTSDRVLYGKLVANDGVDIGDVTINNAAGASAVNIQDGGNTITIDGTLTGITNDVNIADGGNTITVDAVQLDIDDLDHTADSVAIGDGVETLNITAAGEAEIDIAAQSLTALKVSKDANANSETNPIYVQVVTTTVSANEVNDYDTVAAVAKDASSTHTYTAVNTFLLKSVIMSASGAQKCEIKAGAAAAETTRAVVFTSGSKLTEQVFFDPPVEITTGQNILVVRRNDDNSAMDVYSTIIGSDV